MIGKEQIDKIKRQVLEFLEQNKKLLITASSVLVITLVLALNIHLFQITYYTFQEETVKVIQLLSKDVQKEFKQNDWYFKKGIRYLLKDMSDESKSFLEEQFKYFTPETQEEIIAAYNEQKLVFRQNESVFHAITVSNNIEVYREYMRNLSIEEIEKGLKAYLGETPKLTQDVVDRLYKILSLQTEKIGLNLFKLNIYELMRFPHNGDVNSISLKVLDYIQPEAIKGSLFTELKTKPIEIEDFSMWIDILNRKKIISTSEYASFTTSYGNIRRMQEQYKQMLIQEVDLLNIKQMIDVQTEEMTSQITKLTKEVETLKAQKEENTQVLSKLKNYKEMELYVLDQYENGDYEVAIPERSWLFGTYKPSSDRIRLKVTQTTIDTQGVMKFKVYNKGKSEEGLPYYAEVSGEELAQIEELEQKIQTITTSITEKEAEIAKCNQEVGHIREMNNYNQTLLLIEEVERKKVSLELEVKKEKVNIQNLFQVGEIIIEISNK